MASSHYPQQYRFELEVAVDAVTKASKLCQAVFNKLAKGQTLTKDDKSPVTVADFGAQAVINSLLHKSFPSIPIVGEEDSKDLQENAKLSSNVAELVQTVMGNDFTQAQVYEAIDRGNYAGGAEGRFWTLDPIDGTKGFLRGEQFAVCLSLVEKGKVLLGVMGCPNLPVMWSNQDGERGSLFYAVKGHGAYQRPLYTPDATPEPISVSNLTEAKDASFCESVESGHSSQDESAQIASVLGMRNQKPVRMDSQCKYGVIARGDADIYLRIPTNPKYQEKIWDHAVGSLLVTEAGGQVCDVTGAPLDFSVGRTLASNKGVVATNGKVHIMVMGAVKKVLWDKISNGSL
ncbi:3',5'-bisphosphate nucleotidase [Cladochytrium replicatum]|nr:3',5'-bisphosphate nucleotidase [Cladochytrium replicatum]